MRSCKIEDCATSSNDQRKICIQFRRSRWKPDSTIPNARHESSRYVKRNIEACSALGRMSLIQWRSLPRSSVSCTSICIFVCVWFCFVFGFVQGSGPVQIAMGTRHKRCCQLMSLQLTVPICFSLRLSPPFSFVLMVRKGYRDPPYHNWMHAFSAAHFCYLLVKNAGVTDRLRFGYLHCYYSVIALYSVHLRSPTQSVPKNA